MRDDFYLEVRGTLPQIVLNLPLTYRNHIGSTVSEILSYRQRDSSFIYGLALILLKNFYFQLNVVLIMIVRSTKPASKRTASTHARPLPSRAAAALNAASTTTNRAASARPACKATRWWRASALNVTLTPTVGTTTNARY